MIKTVWYKKITERILKNNYCNENKINKSKELNETDYLKAIILEFKKRYTHNKNVNKDVVHLVMTIKLLMYLAEWKHIIEFDARLSNINWFYDGNMIYDNYINNFYINISDNIYPNIEISDEAKECIEFAFKKYEKFDFRYTELTHLCSCTYPFINSEFDTYPDLLLLGFEYKKEYDYKYTINKK